jgi:hypothetical protein
MAKHDSVFCLNCRFDRRSVANETLWDLVPPVGLIICWHSSVSTVTRAQVGLLGLDSQLQAFFCVTSSGVSWPGLGLTTHLHLVSVP